MVAGHLREKNGKYYLVLSYKDANGKWKKKWIATGLPVKGNKKKAEAMLLEKRRTFKPVIEVSKTVSDDMLMADYMEYWLSIIKNSIAINTFASYSDNVKKVIAPYFREKEIRLKDLKAKDIQDFYQNELDRVSANTVLHYHANIHKALKYAVKLDLIDSNPVDKVERPKKERFEGSYYSVDEINALFEAVKGTKIEIPVLIEVFYGLRRSEVIGLKWDNIDFNLNTIKIRHTVTQCSIEGKVLLVKADRTKNNSSLRTLPLLPIVKERLLALKESQAKNRRLCGNCYNNEYTDYICVNEIGDLIKPGYVSDTFRELLKKNGLRNIRFHDLRHSVASLLLSDGKVQLMQVKEWLGHSTIATTADLYGHLDYSAKVATAEAMIECLDLDLK